MASAKFCSECGERFKIKRHSLFPVRVVCTRCSAQSGRRIPTLAAAFILCSAAAFFLGRFANKPEPFHYLGTPVELSLGGAARAEQKDQAADRSSIQTAQEKSDTAVRDAVSLCGAPTRSGKPCQRRVKGGGYCWQHRDKFTGKSAAASSANK